MALARIVCGACGADIPPMAVACPGCGAAVELPRIGPQNAGHVCTLCGFRNPGAATYCESCGARLPGAGSSTPASRPERGEKPAPPSAVPTKGKRPAKEDRSRLDPWQVISGVAIVALVAVVIYLLLPVTPSSTVQTASSPAQGPGSVASMAEIESLQQAVDANPRDAGARLRLANMLHDHGMLMRAIDNYNDYLELEPRDPNARVDLGICYDQLALQDSSHAARYFSLAVREMQTAATNSPKHQPAAFNLGIVNLHMGNLEESNTWFKRAVDLDPNSELGTRAKKILQQHTFPQ